MQEHTKIFKALSDENRIKILEYIQKKRSEPCKSTCEPDGVCASDLAELLGITAATTSHHIKELVNAGLITAHKQGRWVYCRLNEKAFSQAIWFLSKLGKEGV
ncbi:MAG TPA: metalloregulator ArsR/SmtB family transcription factor [Candidatus Saccharimonadales bacterium]|nr:metalloregulator ArsR/SmtB family transcription factor [Candidatus Saccharimonadales bacterium]